MGSFASEISGAASIRRLPLGQHSVTAANVDEVQ